MLAAYSLVKVIESELQAYVSATKGRVVHMLYFFSFVLSFSLSLPVSSLFLALIEIISLSLSLSLSLSIVTHSHCFNMVCVSACRDR
jgi:hypothetical protein